MSTIRTSNFGPLTGNTAIVVDPSTPTNGIARVSPLVSFNPVTASGTSVDFTGIPSWVRRITVMFNGVSTNGTSQMLVQLGAGSVATSGYSSRTTAINGASQTNANSNSNGVGVNTSGNAVAAGTFTGQIIFSLLSSNAWAFCGSTHDNTSGTVQFIQAGIVPLSGALDRVRLTTANGTDAFDAGTVNVMYE